MLYLFNLQSSVSTIILKKDIVRKIYLERRKKLSSSKFEEESSQLVQNTIELLKNISLNVFIAFYPSIQKGK